MKKFFKRLFKRKSTKKLTNEQQGEQVVSFMKKAIKFSFGFIVVYVIWTQIAVGLGIELNDTVTEGVFAFFGAEVMIMCLKKMFSMFLQYKIVENDEEIEEDIEEYDSGCLGVSNNNHCIKINDDF